MSGLLPGQAFPAIDLARTGGGRIDNAIFGEAGAMTVLNVYRGLHCPRCRRQLEDFLANRTAFDAAGIAVVSISTDPADRAAQAVAEWGLGDMAVGFGLGIEQARGLGLYISETTREAEPAHFAEAAVFLVRPDGTLWGSVVNTFPFIRPTAEQILDAVAMQTSRNYPPRGNVAA